MSDNSLNELASANIITPAEALLRENTDFKRFVDRMVATEQTYVIKQRPGVERCVVSLEGEELDSVSPEARSQWLNMCLREYLERKREFEKRHQTRRKLIIKTLLVLCLLLTLLWFVWPLWDMIIGIEESYYTILGLTTKASENDIKRAYREQIKKWHPDHNPQCGEACRLHIIKLRNAYDTLLERGSKQFELINKYRENLSVLRSLVSFRLYSIAAESALGIVELIRIVSRVMHITDYNTLTISIICKVSVMFFFMACEIKINGHFNVMMLINIFFFGVAMCKTSAITMLIEQRKRTAYVNLLMECIAFIVPIVTINSFYVLLHRKELDVATDFLRMIWGALYVLSFLYRFSPNLYDNFIMRKCSLALPYLHANQNYLNWYNFVSVEFGWLLDDIFAFTCRVPSAYRVVVWIVHATYLIQLFSLPKDRPVVRFKTHITKVNSKCNNILNQRCDTNSRSIETEIISEITKRESTTKNLTERVLQEKEEREHKKNNFDSAESVKEESVLRELSLIKNANNIKRNANNSVEKKEIVNKGSDDSKESESYGRESDDDVICKDYDSNSYVAKLELRDDSNTTSFFTSPCTQHPHPLSKEEAKLLTSVDIEHLQWIDVSVNKYIPQLEQCKETFISQFGGKSSMVDFACSDDLQYIVIVAVLNCNEKSHNNSSDNKGNINTDDGSNKHKKNASHSRSRGKTNRQKELAHDDNVMEQYSAVVLFRDFNPQACKIFAMQNGPRVFYNYWFTSPEYRQNAIKNYVNYFGSINRWSFSEFWRLGKSLSLLMLKDVKGSNENSFLSDNTLQCTPFASKQVHELWEILVYVMCVTFAILLSALIFINYSPLQVLKALSSLPITLNPFVSNRFTMHDVQNNELPSGENASKIAASLFVFGTKFLMCTADL